MYCVDFNKGIRISFNRQENENNAAMSVVAVSFEIDLDLALEAV
jgi:hypothetical protein